MNNKWDNFFIETVKNIAKLSTCYKYQVGCLIVKEKRIISIGYNGTPSGWKHCIEDNKLHSKYEIHAEMNAIGFAVRNGISTEGSEMYITHLPCFSCAKLIVASRIRKVVYINDYEDWTVNDNTIEFLKVNNVEVIKYDRNMETQKKCN